MLDHVSIGISDRTRAGYFYDAVLQTLGLQKVADYGESFAYGPSMEAPSFCLVEHKDVVRNSGFHLAFRVPDRASVRRFHHAALRHGGTDDGIPGARENTEHYYAAFVLDPDGNKIEACCYEPA
jgi:catechol 2,3-dioxygenase-like lactoylglutathione lyase family enzyme